MLKIVEITSGSKPEGNVLYFGSTETHDFYIKAYGDVYMEWKYNDFFDKARGVFRRKGFERAKSMPADRLLSHDNSWLK